MNKITNIKRKKSKSILYVIFENDKIQCVSFKITEKIILSLESRCVLNEGLQETDKLQKNRILYCS